MYAMLRGLLVNVSFNTCSGFDKKWLCCCLLFTCSMTLTQTERGYPPALEHIGKPIYIKNEMGMLVPVFFTCHLKLVTLMHVDYVSTL